MPASSDVPNGGSGGGTTPHNSKSPPAIISLPPSPPALTPQHRRTCRRRATIAVVTICLLLTAVIVLQIVIVGLILNSCLVQNATGVSPFVRSQTGQAPSELEVRGQLLQLADLLSWDAKCNRVLHDLVVSCYGAPDYLANKAKETSRGGGRFHFNRNFPHNLETPPRHALKPRKLRPQKPPMSELAKTTKVMKCGTIVIAKEGYKFSIVFRNKKCSLAKCEAKSEQCKQIIL
ncbi:conserved hypothetical protein [Echinococcus multilocularis]|uniref:Uncharacterized protein n=1 Tax=Echinococcus multilocularis TaxID=6211 RepID=A0A068Y3B2_ECHMU|nr:conserved hypothetical protein [Echinococcus multilocularis]